MAASTPSRSGPGVAPRVLFGPQPVPPLGPDVSEDLGPWRRWVAARESQRLARVPPPPSQPEMTVVLAVDRPELFALPRCLRALAAQTHDRFRVEIAVAPCTDEPVRRVVDRELASLATAPTRAVTIEEGDVASCVTRVVGESGHGALVLVDQYDVLAPDALAQLAIALFDADVAYGDEDCVTRDGAAWGPALKPDWSPELLLSSPYIGHPVALRAAAVVAAGGAPPPGEGDWEHDLLLKVTERTGRVAHVAEVLCHRQRDAPAPSTCGPQAVTDALARRGEGADVADGPVPGTWRVRRRPAGMPLVSAIVPFRDNPALLRACVDSVTRTTAGTGLELVLVDNGSVEPETRTLVERLGGRRDAVVHCDDRPFNWAALNNAAADVAHGDVLLFLNDDVEARSPGWLEALVAQAQRPDVGAVGARLLYPGGTVQHAGVVLGLVGPASHVLAGLDADRPGYLGMAVLTRDVSAVTGACMATRREVFDRMGRFDEALAVDYSDVDYCLRARAAGMRVLYEPQAELVHHESPSRGSAVDVGELDRFVRRWGPSIDRGDPFYNRNLTRTDGSAALRRERDPLTVWRTNYALWRALSLRSPGTMWAAAPSVLRRLLERRRRRVRP